MGHRRILLLTALLAGALSLNPTIANAHPAQTASECDGAWALLQAGDLDGARAAFLDSQNDPACQLGPELVETQRDRAQARADECTESADDLAEETDTAAWDKAYPIVLATCGEAIALDDAQADELAATLRDLPDGPADPPSASERAESWWSDVWGNAQDVAVVVGQVLLAVLIALPLLNAIGTVTGRHGPKRLRRRLGRAHWRRSVAIVPLVVAVVLAFTEHGSTWWAAGIPLSVACLALASSFEDTWAGLWRTVVAVLAVTVAAVVGLAIDSDETAEAVLVVAMPVLAFVLLGWVLAQHRRVRIDAFTGDGGSIPFAELVATELVLLSQPRSGNLTVVDPLAAANTQLDGDSVSLLAGPENKIVRAAMTVFRSAFQTGTDWIVSGQMICAETKVRSLSIQLKRGRNTIAVERIDPAAYTTARPGGDGADDSKKATGPNDVDLAFPAAAWVFVELQRELDGDVDGTDTDGATVPTSIALHAAAVQARKAGDTELAASLFGRAVEADPGNLPARLAFAQFAVTVAEPKQVEARTVHLRAVVDGIVEAVDDDLGTVSADTELMARHARVVADLNLLASKADANGVTTADDAACLERTRAELEALTRRFEEKQGRLTPGRRHALEASIASMKPLLPDGLPTEERAVWLGEVRHSVRAIYNAAAGAASPLHSAGDRDESIDLLTVAAAHPAYRKAATDDPFFRPLKNDDRYRKLVGTKPEVDPTGLASLDVIGKQYAIELEAVQITTITGLAGATAAALSQATSASTALTEVWRDLADVGTIRADLPLPHLNLLYRSGVTTRRKLATSAPERLHAVITGLATAAGVEDAPDLATVTAYIEEAGTR